MPYLNCGGVETALLALLNVLNRELYDITLLLLKENGTFHDQIPKDIKVSTIPLPKHEHGIFYGKKEILKYHIKKKQFWEIPYFLIHNLKYSITENRTQNALYFKKIANNINEFPEKFDLAIDYFGYATFTTFYVAEKVQAKIKISWLHSILSRYQPLSFEKWYAKMDVIFACSKMVKEDFDILFPNIKKTALFYNIISPEEIRIKANSGSGFEDDFHGIRILTVGRVCHEKGADIALFVFKRLIMENYNIRWYMIGPYTEEELKQLSQHLSTEQEKENFILMGIRKNPYRYMEQCDIYVQPSRYEGYCTTTNEARILRCPIVTTNVSGSQEQFIDGKTGFIAEKSIEDIFQKIKILLDQPDLRNHFKQNLQNINCDTREYIKKIDVLLS